MFKDILRDILRMFSGCFRVVLGISGIKLLHNMATNKTKLRNKYKQQTKETLNVESGVLVAKCP